jgi:ribosome-associated protein
VPSIRVAPGVTIEKADVQEVFVRSSGPGGQNVNKVATAVQLRFDAGRGSGLPEEVRSRLRVLAGRRMTASGVLVIEARRFRTQEGNRRDAWERLLELLRRAARPPAVRRETSPPPGADVRRLEAKRARGSAKRLRGKVRGDEA